MEEIIKLDSVDLVYQSAESLSIKKAVKMLITRKFKNDFLMQYKALNNISFSIKKGNVYGIIGNNGAGKSTLLRILSGAMSPTAGTIERKYTTINLLALGVGFTKDLTGYENIFLNGMILGFSKKKIKEKLADIIEYSELGDFIYKPMKTYSSGMVSRLGFSIAINLKPEVLLVDEILSVGDVKFREKSFNSIRKYIEDENTTVVIVSHSMQQIKDLCNYVIWIEKGNLIAKGDTHAILEVYGKVSKEYITLKEARKELTERIGIDNRRIFLDISTYQLYLESPEEKRLFGKIYEYKKSFKVGNTILNVTIRRLHNDDFFIYFAVEGKDEIKVNLQVDEVKDRLHFDNYYKKPSDYDKLRDGIETGPNSFIDLKLGAMMISKIMHFDEFKAENSEEENLQLLHLLSESNNIKLINNKEFEITIPRNSSKASFFIILSKSKLFRSFNNMKTYMEYYFSAIENHVNKNPFFQLAEGTYTKVTEESTASSDNVYEYTLTNAWNMDYIQFYQSTNERFFLDLMENAVLQALIYKEEKENIFLTNCITTDCYVVEFLKLFESNNPLRDKITPIRDFADFLYIYYENNKRTYAFDEYVFFPEDLNNKATNVVNIKLENQVRIIKLLIEGYKRYEDIRYKNLADKILLFIDAHKKNWVNAKSGDLYQYASYNKSSKAIEFYHRDSIYATLKELLQLQEVYTEVYGGNATCITYLIDAKMTYLKENGYDINNENTLNEVNICLIKRK